MLKWSYNTAPDIPDAVYTAKIISIVERKSSKGNDMWVFSLALKEFNATIKYFMVTDGNFDSRTAGTIQSNIERVAKCFSIPEGATQSDEWLAHSGIIETFHKTADNGNTYVNVKKFFSPSAGKKALAEQIAARMIDGSVK